MGNSEGAPPVITVSWDAELGSDVAGRLASGVSRGLEPCMDSWLGIDAGLSS